jgi:hypothetical protein
MELLDLSVEEEEPMEKYLYVYYGGMTATTPAAQKKSMDAWMKWFSDMGKAVVDAGNPTVPGKEVSKAGSKKMTLTKPVSGYSIVQAENMEIAVKMAKMSPIVNEGGKIAIYTITPVM